MIGGSFSLVHGGATQPAGNQPQSAAFQPKVLPGINMLLTEQKDLIRGKKIGLITNPSGILADGRQNIDALAADPDVKLVALFGPEHGVRGQFYGGDSVDSGKDPMTGITVYSLYGKTSVPKQEWLKELDALVYDIQDTTNRSYTFYATMAKAMGAAKEAGIPFIVCDRPTPMSGNLVDGNILDPSKGTSMVGLYPVAYIYGMTPGETAVWLNKTLDLKADLFYRLNVFSVHLPPLRERGDDVLLLAHHFTRDLGARLGKGEAGLSRDAQEALRSYPWPGNIRELANAVERALILAEGDLLTAAHFGLDGGRRPRLEGTSGHRSEPAAPEALVDLERRAILAALERTKGNKTRAAALLGITRSKLHTRVRRYGLAAEPTV